MFKKLYEFNVLEEADTIEKTVTTNEKGETVTVEKPVKKHLLRKFILKRPNRKQFDESEIYHGARVSEFIKKGCLTRKQLQAKFNNEGTTVSDREKKEYESLVSQLFEAEEKIKFLSLIKESERTEAQKKELADAVASTVIVKSKMQDMEFEQLSLFDHTAENLARARMAVWWVFELAYVDIEGKEPKPLFGNGNIEEKDAQYTKFEEEERVIELTAIRRFLLLVSFCFARQWSLTVEEIENFANEIGLSDKLPEEKVVENEKL